MNYLVITGLIVIILLLLAENMSVVNRLRTGFSARSMRLMAGVVVLSMLVLFFPKLKETYQRYKQRLS